MTTWRSQSGANALRTTALAAAVGARSPSPRPAHARQPCKGAHAEEQPERQAAEPIHAFGNGPFVADVPGCLLSGRAASCADALLLFLRLTR